MNNVADSILAVLRRYLSDATSRALLASAARRANLRLITISHADVPSLVRELGPGLNIFLQERTTLNHCKKELASIATENSTPVESPLPCNDDGRPREFDDRALGKDMATPLHQPEISDPTLFLSKAYRSKWGLGAGLRGTERLTDPFKLDKHVTSVLTGARLFLASETFPPSSLWTRVTPADQQWLEREAGGAPGSLVWPGLFPRHHQKLARLLLASAGHYDSRMVLSAARDAYAADRGAFLPEKPRESRRYHAHDAFACALVHPGISMDERHALVLETLAPGPRGPRSRRKTWAILRFACKNEFLTPDRLPREIVKRLSC